MVEYDAHFVVIGRTEIEVTRAPSFSAQPRTACNRIASGILPTMEERKAAAMRIDRMREENARHFGIQDVTLGAVRESRDRP